MSRRTDAQARRVAAAQSLPSLASLPIGFNVPGGESATEQAGLKKSAPVENVAEDNLSDATQAYKNLSLMTLERVMNMYGVRDSDVENAMPLLVLIGLNAGFRPSIQDVAPHTEGDKITDHDSAVRISTDVLLGPDYSDNGHRNDDINKMITDIFSGKSELAARFSEPSELAVAYELLGRYTPAECDAFADEYVPIGEPVPDTVDAHPHAADVALPVVEQVGVPCDQLPATDGEVAVGNEYIEYMFSIMVYCVFFLLLTVPTYVWTFSLWLLQRRDGKRAAMLKRAREICNATEQPRVTMEGEGHSFRVSCYNALHRLMFDPFRPEGRGDLLPDVNADTTTTRTETLITTTTHAKTLITAFKAAMTRDIESSIGKFGVTGIVDVGEAAGSPPPLPVDLTINDDGELQRRAEADAAADASATLTQLGKLLAYAIDPYARIVQSVSTATKEDVEKITEFYVKNVGEPVANDTIAEMRTVLTTSQALSSWRWWPLHVFPFSLLSQVVNPDGAPETYPYTARIERTNFDEQLHRVCAEGFTQSFATTLPRGQNAREELLPPWIIRMSKPPTKSDGFCIVKSGEKEVYDEGLAESFIPDGYINRVTRIQIGCLCAIIIRACVQPADFDAGVNDILTSAQMDLSKTQSLARGVLSCIIKAFTGEGASEDDTDTRRLTQLVNTLREKGENTWLFDRYILRDLIVGFIGASHQRLYRADSMRVTWSIVGNNRLVQDVIGGTDILPDAKNDFEQMNYWIRRLHLSPRGLLSAAVPVVIALYRAYAFAKKTINNPNLAPERKKINDAVSKALKHKDDIARSRNWMQVADGLHDNFPWWSQFVFESAAVGKRIDDNWMALKTLDDKLAVRSNAAVGAMMEVTAYALVDGVGLQPLVHIYDAFHGRWPSNGIAGWVPALERDAALPLVLMAERVDQPVVNDAIELMGKHALIGPEALLDAKNMERANRCLLRYAQVAKSEIGGSALPDEYMAKGAMNRYSASTHFVLLIGLLFFIKCFRVGGQRAVVGLFEKWTGNRDSDKIEAIINSAKIRANGRRAAVSPGRRERQRLLSASAPAAMRVPTAQVAPTASRHEPLSAIGVTFSPALDKSRQEDIDALTKAVNAVMEGDVDGVAPLVRRFQQHAGLPPENAKL